ncbi:hypothetical protein BN2476_1280014 [Paraburkholderia piptadeniae]|uniref:Uncharacterized protein n=1 Tax=Paraburkholderia piptadeniae TaxID=1701573 RepID=A0A1N7SWA9_9BURK|nr:hypothetical protein BN2476_1280014 [Paraburkholderia piptadeniae]
MVELSAALPHDGAHAYDATNTLVTGANARTGTVNFDAWFKETHATK